MPGVLVVAAIVAVLAYILWAPLHHALVAFLALIILVPTVLVFPNGLTSALSVPRLAVVALALRLFICIRRREVPLAVIRPTIVHAAFLLFLAIMVVTGVLLAAPQTPIAGSMNRWFGMVEQFAVFAVVLAVARTYRDTQPLARSITVLIGVSAGIAFLEKLTGVSWARLLLFHIPGLQHVLGAIPLEQRGGGVRVRAASEFALEYGWICAIAIPFAAVVAIRARTWGLRIVPFLVIIALYWTNSRSAFAGVVVGIAVVAFLSRDRRVSRVAFTALIVGGAFALSVPSIRAPFSGARQTSSTKIREQRLPEITELVRPRAYQGLGFEGLIPHGFPATDASYLLAYAESGVVGLAALLALLIVVLVYCSIGVRGPPSSNRVLATAVIGGLLAAVLGGAAFDLFTVNGSADLFWVLAALGVLMAERNRAVTPVLRFPAPRAALVLLGVAVGFALRVAIPTHAAIVTPFDALSPPRVVYTTGDTVFAGGILLHTVCQRADSVRLPPKTGLDCFDPHTTPGFGTLRVDAPTLAQARDGTDRIVHALETDLPATQIHPATTEVGRPTWARTAPASLGVGMLLLALTCPVPKRRDQELDADARASTAPARL